MGLDSSRYWVDVGLRFWRICYIYRWFSDVSLFVPIRVDEFDFLFDGYLKICEVDYE